MYRLLIEFKFILTHNPQYTLRVFWFFPPLSGLSSKWTKTLREKTRIQTYESTDNSLCTYFKVQIGCGRRENMKSDKLK